MAPFLLSSGDELHDAHADCNCCDPRHFLQVKLRVDAMLGNAAEGLHDKKILRDCQESCVPGNNRVDGGRIWRSRRITLDQLWRAAIRRRSFRKTGLFDELKKALAERVLNAELDDHLHSEAADGTKNRRDSYSMKTVLTETAKIDVAIPGDREGTFESEANPAL
jgi:Transposase, Mutator family